MDYFLDNWGSFVGLISLAITVVGFTLAIVRATQARSYAKAAEAASRETRSAITSVLTVVDLQRAIALVQRLKVLCRDERWEVSLEHYQPLRAMLADIDGRYPMLDQVQHTVFQEAIMQLTDIEDSVANTLRDGNNPSQQHNFGELLNDIQVGLEQIASTTYFSGS